jgi:hypothetical protein
MPSVPTPITAVEGDWEGLKGQVWELIRNIYEDRIGGAIVGDVFSTENDYLSLQVGTGLIKTNGELATSLDSSTLKTATGSTSGSLANGAAVNITMQTLTFFPNFYAAGSLVYLKGNTDAMDNTTTGKIALHNGSGSTSAYSVNYEYVTATDKPFIYALQDKKTGEISHVWECSDPPPGLWGLKVLPENWNRPIDVYLIDEKEKKQHKVDFTEMVIHNYPLDDYKELVKRRVKDKIPMVDMLNKDFEFNKSKELFIRKSHA